MRLRLLHVISTLRCIQWLSQLAASKLHESSFSIPWSAPAVWFAFYCTHDIQEACSYCHARSLYRMALAFAAFTLALHDAILSLL